MTRDKKRTEREMAADVAFVLRSKKLSYAAKWIVLKNVIWSWTNQNGCGYETPAAKVAPKKETNRDHVVPVSFLIDLIVDLGKPNEGEVLDVLKRYAITCRVTKAEHGLLNAEFKQEMPDEFVETDNAFERYERVGIAYVKTSNT